MNNWELLNDCGEYFMKRYPRKLHAISRLMGKNDDYAKGILRSKMPRDNSVNSMLNAFEIYEEKYGESKYKKYY